ncbi:hypothetical protein D3C80_1806890 [compost metagenome]
MSILGHLLESESLRGEHYRYHYILAGIRHKLAQFTECLDSFEQSIQSAVSSGHDIDLYILYHFQLVLQLLSVNQKELSIANLSAKQLQGSSSDQYWKQMCDRYHLEPYVSKMKQITYQR